MCSVSVPLLASNDSIYDSDACCKEALLAINGAGTIDIMKHYTCQDSCPFPFCTVDEFRNAAKQTTQQSKDQLRRAVSSQLDHGLSVAALSVNLNRHMNINFSDMRSILKRDHHVAKAEHCHWCNIEILADASRILCRSRVCTIALDHTENGDKVVALLYTHKRASAIESALSETLIEYVFGEHAHIIKHEEQSHTHWSVENVSAIEIQGIVTKMNYLSNYTDKLR